MSVLYSSANRIFKGRLSSSQENDDGLIRVVQSYVVIT